MADKRHVVCPQCDTVNAVPPDRPGAAAKCGHCHAKLFPGAPVELSGERLNRHLANSDIPVIVDFWAPWCGPCRAFAPVFARAAQDLEPQARFVKVNVDENPQAAQTWGVQGIPALFAFKNGRVAAHQAGAVDVNTLKSWIERLAA